MRGRAAKWAITLVIFFGVPAALVWIFMPYLDLSHATYLAAQGEYPKALRTLNRAIRFNSGMASAYTRRGYVFDKLGDRGNAMEDFNRAISISDSDWEPFNNRAWVLAEQPNPDLTRALQDANQAASLCSTCAPIFDTRGYIQLQTNQLDAALRDLNRALDLNPRLGEAYYHRSLYYERVHDKSNAKRDQRRAHEFGYFEDTDDDTATKSQQVSLAP